MGLTSVNSLLMTDPQAFATSLGDNNDLALASTLLAVTAANHLDAITGATPPMDGSGYILWVYNASASNSLVIKGSSASSTAGYRFSLGGGSTTLTLAPGQAQQFVFIVGTGWVTPRPGTFA